MFRVIVPVAFGLGALALAGCGDKPAASTPSEFKNKKDDHDHADHAGGKEDVTLPDGKKCHAVLAAHMPAKGEKALEVSFETLEKQAKPVTLPETTKLSLRVQRGEKVETVELKPGPKDERKSDPAGQCSRFEGDADWITPADKLTVTLTIEGAAKKTVWVDFEPGKNAHKDHDH